MGPRNLLKTYLEPMCAAALHEQRALIGCLAVERFLTRAGFNKPPEHWTLRPHAGDLGNASPLPGSLSSQVCVAPLALRGLQSRVSDSAMIDKPEPRRFPPPWIAEETDACFIVR